ncbi:hypothetical protein IW140_003295 [Coemansia sp. RSA 1813]|nr:hypothetical protein EV178_002915 [Coemansia sp. RSA 1646]KAJ1771704.1 hypothetical protein LPJ74_002131 [Coemansia sp. RSA 1843]KAJ2089660.1 hypothetical protein IW138_003258 [Coemansia sp. RSA 986]KAJ2214145.1 hypothetical protein EV179_003284 [Coemansia sp. RSA 487]KAJ2569203.1 hypothetical protein IW140_003295 [Coemansia sp. RSA 1813]
MRLPNPVSLLSLYMMFSSAMGDTTDYDNFMSSLSYNWQNEFSDLRYQVDQLQKTDPLKYQQLAAQLGLKPGAQIDVPSQFNGVWASKFVMGAGLYTPPAAPTQAATFDPSQAKPTDGSSLLITAVLTGNSATPSATDDGQSVEVSTLSDGSVTTVEHSNGSSDDAEDVASDLDSADPSTSMFEQDGNPIVGNFNTDFTPIAPTGIGYSAAPPASIPLIRGIVSAVLASLLLF